jgi:hypothetical protein
MAKHVRFVAVARLEDRVVVAAHAPAPCATVPLAAVGDVLAQPNLVGALPGRHYTITADGATWHLRCDDSRYCYWQSVIVTCAATIRGIVIGKA